MHWASFDLIITPKQNNVLTTLVEDYFFPMLLATKPLKLTNFDVSWYIIPNPDERKNDPRTKNTKNRKTKFLVQLTFSQFQRVN